MAARRADKSPRRVGLQPAVAFSPVPDAVLRTKHPAASLTVKNGEVADCDAERADRDVAGAPSRDQLAISSLCIGKWIDGHPESIARGAPPRSGPAPGSV